MRGGGEEIPHVQVISGGREEYPVSQVVETPVRK